VAAVVLLGALAAVVVTASLTSGRQVLTPAEARRSAPAHGDVEVAGTATRVTHGHLTLRGGGAGLRVRYRGVAPDGLRAGARVTVTGRLRAGVLVARPGGIEATCAEEHC
jgi:cytochrome c-type biogenesis protein CcmE